MKTDYNYHLNLSSGHARGFARSSHLPTFKIRRELIFRIRGKIDLAAYRLDLRTRSILSKSVSTIYAPLGATWGNVGLRGATWDYVAPLGEKWRNRVERGAARHNVLQRGATMRRHEDG